jgi:hypothetical protein
LAPHQQHAASELGGWCGFAKHTASAELQSRGCCGVATPASCFGLICSLEMLRCESTFLAFYDIGLVIGLENI